MKSSELAQQLMLQPDREVLMLVGNQWCEVVGTKATGQHRNAVTLELRDGTADLTRQRQSGGTVIGDSIEGLEP